MCGTCETNVGKIGNNIYSDLNGKNCLEDQGISGTIKTSTKIGLKARGFEDV
jgi:hypothetical protein